MASVRVIKVPDVGEGIAEVELVEWHVQVGDTVAEDQSLADVMTDKASVEIPSPVAGKVLALGGKVGEMMAVGAELIRIGVGDGAMPGEAAVSATPSPQPSPRRGEGAMPKPAPTPSAAPVPPPASSTEAERQIPPPLPLSGRGPGRGQPGDRPIAAPAVRRRAWELGIDLQAVQPSGTAGRITHADLESHAAAHASQPAPIKDAAAPTASTPGFAQRTDEQAIPVIGLRRRIATQMQESKRRIPHFSYVEELDVTELESLRGTLNARYAKERGKLTMLPLLMRAMVLALRDFPQINARFDDDVGVITRFGAVHLGVATQTPHGLMVPVVRHAETRNLWSLAAEVARLAEAARTGRATRDELAGSTITISSLGALGGIASTPVINRPEVAIVAVNRIVERPVIRDGAVVARRTMNLSSSFDHRAVDGMDAAQFIQAVRTLVERPALLFVE